MPLTRRILVVDDNSSDRETIRRFLTREKRFQYRVEETATGEEALERCQHQPFDLVLLDEHLPGLSGLEVLRRLRALPGWNAAVVTLTYDSHAELARSSLEAGATDFLGKDDLTESVLCRAVDNALTKEQLQQQLRRAAHQTARLQEMTAELAGAAAPEDVVRIALREGVAAVEAQAGFLSLISEDGAFLEMHPRVGFREDATQGWERIPLEMPLPITEAVRTGQVVVCGSLAERDVRYPALARAPRYNEALAAIPLKTGKGVLGAMGVSFLLPRGFTSTEQDLFRLVGRLCAQALERAQAQSRVQSQQALLDAVLRHMPTGVIVVAPSGQVLVCNEQLRQMLSGATPPPSEPPDPAHQTLPLTPERWPLARAALRGEQLSGQEVPLRLSDGTERTLRVFSSPVYAQDKQLLAGVTVAEDITEKKRAEQKLRATEERFRAMVNAVPSILFERHEQVLTWVSGSWSAYSGQTHEQSSMDQGWMEAIHPEDRQQTAERWKQAIATRSVFEGRKRLRRADGVYRWFVVRAVPRTDGADGTTRWLGSCTDIDETIRAEEESRKRALFEQHLLGIVSHDLKSPLSVILMSAGMLTQWQPQDERIHRAVKRIQTAGERCNRMISDLLDFTQARLGSGIPIHSAPGDLREFVKRALDEVLSAYPHRSVTFEAPGALPGVWDGERLTQVATNLIVNALKYSPEDSTVSVRLKEEPPHAALEVHNWGPGISPQLLPHLFEPLQQGAVGKERTGRSVGLGLYIVRELTRAHGGHVEVSSSDHEGTRFRVTLPTKPLGAAAP